MPVGKDRSCALRFSGGLGFTKLNCDAAILDHRMQYIPLNKAATADKLKKTVSGVNTKKVEFKVDFLSA